MKRTLYLTGGICWLLLALACAALLLQYVLQGAGLQFLPFLSNASITLGWIHVIGFASAMLLCFSIAMGMLARTGWKSSTVKPNDKVTVLMNPLKSGAASGRLLKVTLPDGRVMGPGGSAPPPKPDGE